MMMMMIVVVFVHYHYQMVVILLIPTQFILNFQLILMKLLFRTLEVVKKMEKCQLFNQPNFKL